MYIRRPGKNKRRNASKYALLLLACIGYSCVAPEPINEDPSKDKILIPISLQNEIVVANIPTRAEQITSNDLCAIAVTVKGKPFAYGLFDTPDIPPIEMITGETYNIECTVVKNGKTAIYNDDKGYCSPFRIVNKPTPVTNSFQYECANVFTELLKGTATIPNGKKGKLTQYPLLDRYTGIIADFSATPASKISLELKRAVFGLTPQSQGLKSGRIELYIGYRTSLPIILFPQDELKPAVEYIFSLYNKTGDNAIVSVDYAETVQLHIVKYDSDGMPSPASVHPIVVKRKSTYPILIKIDQTSSSTITFEDPTLKEEDPIIIQ